MLFGPLRDTHDPECDRLDMGVLRTSKWKSFKEGPVPLGPGVVDTHPPSDRTPTPEAPTSRGRNENEVRGRTTFSCGHVPLSTGEGRGGLLTVSPTRSRHRRRGPGLKYTRPVPEGPDHTETRYRSNVLSYSTQTATRGVSVPTGDSHGKRGRERSSPADVEAGQESP